jgi:hypothetical protein
MKAYQNRRWQRRRAARNVSRVNTAALIVLAAAAVAIAASAYLRPVGAEDDCAYNTWAVKRLPVIGLVCINEPSFNPAKQEN